MSIYCSTASFWEDHTESCAQMVRTDDKDAPIEVHAAGEVRYYREDKSQPCTCHESPLIYRESHVLPSDDDPRGGSFDLGEIPGFIGDGTREPLDRTESSGAVWPWLRVSVNEATVVLDRSQVLKVYHYLGDWLIASDPAERERSHD